MEAGRDDRARRHCSPHDAVVRHLRQARTVDDALQRAAEGVAEVAGGDAGVAVRLAGECIETLAVVGAGTAELVAWEDRLREGPCYDGPDAAAVVHARDLAEASPWPALGPRLAASGCRSLLAFGQAVGGDGGEERTCVVEVFAPAPLRPAEVVVAAAQAAAVCPVVLLHRRQTDALSRALETRDLIGQAKGLLMAWQETTSDAAFEVLRSESQHLNVKVRDLAADLVTRANRWAPE